MLAEAASSGSIGGAAARAVPPSTDAVPKIPIVVPPIAPAIPRSNGVAPEPMPPAYNGLLRSWKTVLAAGPALGSGPGVPAAVLPGLAATVNTPPSAVVASASSWLATMGACVALAFATGATLPGLRTLMPYLAWVVMAPLVGWWANRFPAVGRRNLTIHLLSAPLAVALDQAIFRALLLLLTGVWETPSTRPAYLFTALWIGLLLYVSTVWLVTALGSLAQAQRVELRQAELESETLSADLDLTLSRLGPEELDVMIGRVRAVVGTSAAAADDAIDALGRYLRLALRGVEAAKWTLRRELELARAYLDFEAACSRRPLELVPPATTAVRLDRTVRQHVLVGAVADLVASETGPLRLEVADAPGTLTLRIFAVDGGEPLLTFRVAA